MVGSSLESRIESIRSWKILHRNAALFSGEEIMLNKTITIRTVGKWNVHHYGVLHCLLQPISDSMLVIFRLNDCNRSAFVQIKNIVCFLGFLAGDHISSQVDLSICNSCLHCNETKRPLFCYGRRNKLKLDILFSHLPFR